MLLEVDVKPGATGFTRTRGGEADQFPSNAMSSGIAGNDRVEKEGVDRPVPCDVDEADEPPIVSGADPAQAVTVDSTPCIHIVPSRTSNRTPPYGT